MARHPPAMWWRRRARRSCCHGAGLVPPAVPPSCGPTYAEHRPRRRARRTRRHRSCATSMSWRARSRGRGQPEQPGRPHRRREQRCWPGGRSAHVRRAAGGRRSLHGRRPAGASLAGELRATTSWCCVRWKFFGLAGLRLGFALAPPRLVDAGRSGARTLGGFRACGFCRGQGFG